MHHDSGSALQKVTFVLVLFVAAAAGYLVVRDRLRAEREREAEAQAREQEAEISKAITTFSSNRVVTNSVLYAPLRDRVVTNTVRVPSNRFIAVSKTNVTAAHPAAVFVGEERPYPRNGVQVAVADSSPVFPGGGGRSGSASVTGRVLLRGTPPPEKAIVLDAACAALQPAPITTRHYVVGEGGGLADVFVYVKAGAPSVAAPTSGTLPLLDQVNCEYQPYIIGVQAGQGLNVRNSDGLLHNVHVLAKAPGNRERNIGQPVKGMVSRLVFDKPEVFVQFKCDVHPWMFAYVGVVDHPWFAVTDRSGSFALPSGLPAGQYTLAAVHRKLGEQTQTITVGANGSAPVMFTLEVPGP